MFTQKQITLFWSNVDIRASDECWNWKLSVDRYGYGKVKINHTAYISHRIAYQLIYGSIPENKHILHNCDNTRCCNPYHLRPGSRAQNMQDMISRGRQATTTRQRKLNQEKADSIRIEFQLGATKRGLAKKYGVCPRHIRDILRGGCWKNSLLPTT